VHKGIILVITNSSKEVGMCYLLDDETDARVIPIGFDESPTSLLVKLVKRDDYHVADADDREFEETDSLFAYATMK
jgi:hypothetical protein